MVQEEAKSHEDADGRVAAHLLGSCYRTELSLSHRHGDMHGIGGFLN